MEEHIFSITQKHFDEIKAHRRYLHQHPELSFNEINTSNYIQNFLEKENIPFETGFAGNAVLGIIGNNKSTKTIVLRADMDALPIEENNIIDYKSKNKGIMHACGHDVHMSCLMGASKIINSLKPKLKDKKILLLFQHAEEKLPGGAKEILDSGVLDKYQPNLFIGQHVYPDLKVGLIGYKPGKYMASSDEIYITVKGKGGHGALPHKAKDPIYAASTIVVALQQAVSRLANPGIPTVLTIGKISGGTVGNVIPDKVNLEGTFRTMDEKQRDYLHQEITKITNQAAITAGCEAKITIKKGYPSLHNNEDLTEKAIKLSENLFGAENIKHLDIRMTAEDFSYYAQKYPAVFYRLGTGIYNDKESPALHNSYFNIDENALITGTANLVYLALNL